MSLQVHDPRSRTRSKSPGRSRSRSRSRDSRAPSPTPSRADRPHSRSPSIEVRGPKSSTSNYASDEDAEIERQYKLLKEGRLRDDEPRHVVSRAPRSPARYDVRRSDDEDSDRRRGREGVSASSRRRRDAYEDGYEHSEREDNDTRLIQLGE